MPDLAERIASLPPEKRQLFEKLLKQERLEIRQPVVSSVVGSVIRRQPRGQGVNRFVTSFAQQRLWFLDQFALGSSAYNMPFALRLKGSLDVPALERAMTEVIGRHEVLRTRFVVEEGEPVQVVEERAPFVSPVVQVSAGQVVEQLIREEASLPFDLETGPLVRARLLRLSEDEHVLVFTMHHIVSDGWSMGVLMREVGALYDAYSRGTESPLAELPIQYADYAVWQREWLQGEALERQLEYWRKQLANAPVLELPAEKPRSLSAQSAESEVRLSAEAVVRLRELGRQEGCTLFMTLLAAFQIVLWRYGRQRDLVIGTPVANRKQGGTEGLIGFFVNTLALRTELDERLTFRELLARVRETCLGAYAHQDMPFEKLVDDLGVKREPNRNPLFDVMLVLQGAGEQGVPGLGGLAVNAEEWGGAGVLGAKFDLLLTLTEQRGGGVHGKLEYRAEMFGEALMHRMGQHLLQVVEDAAADEETRLSALGLIGESERHQQLVQWNDTHREYERERCVHELFEAQVTAHPTETALIFDGRSITYGELNRRANQLARYLKRKGIGPESIVGLVTERSPEMIVSLLAILKAGGAYLPLDPRHPEARLRMMLEDAGAALLLTQAPWPGGPLSETVIVCLDDERESIAAEPEENLPHTTTPENLIYVMYTSGSTGQAKGVAVAHRSVVRLVREANYVELGPEQVLLQLAPVSFDASTFEVWGALLNGARLVVAPPGPLSLEEVGRTVREAGVTTLWLTAGLFHQMVDERVDDLRGVKQLLAGGDVLSPQHVRRVLEASDGMVLVNGYGPTENTTFTACNPVTHTGQIGETVSIGRPISNTQIYILDDALQPVPVGVAGELYTGGDGLSRGYLRQPALTAERFVPNPFSVEGGRLYRTGDLARYLEDGRIEFVGRVDDQVKVRGYRIEPGEIEAALIECEGVRESVVVVREDARGEKLLVAYVVGESSEPPRAAELRASLRERLPDYMVPSAFVMLDELPLTPNGKVDRRALPAPELSGEQVGDSSQAPRTPIEEVLAEIFADVLHVASVGVVENFFELGGHSLLATRVVSRVRTAFGVEVALRTLFERPTVAALSEEIEALLRIGSGSEVPPLVRRETDGPLPLSFAQQRLWFLDQLEPGSSAYNMPFALRLKGSLDVPALERAMTEVIKRHEVLRTTFRIVDEQPVQVIGEPAPFVLPVVQVGKGPEQDVAELIQEEASLPFDLETGPLVRARLLRLKEQEHVLLFTMHHIVSDGWSMDVLMREVSALYNAYQQGEESTLSELPIQYGDYAVWQREWLGGEALERQLDYWREQLANAPALELPTDRPRPAVQRFEGATVSFTIDPEVTRRLRELSRREGTTLFMTLLAAFNTLLTRYTAQVDVSVGTPVAGRTRAETEGLIGFFVNTLVLRLDASGDPTFAELLGRVREVCFGAYAHQDVPFERVVEELRPERELSRSPLFQAMFLLQNASPKTAVLHGLSVEPLQSTGVNAKFDVTLSLNESEAGVHGTLEYSSHLFDAATMERFAEHFRRLAEAAAAAPDEKISALSMLAPAERLQLVEEFNDTHRDYPRHLTLTEMFEAQVARTPEAQAVLCEDARLTYRQLNARANQLAHYLKRLGVEPETRVGICVERSVEMLVGLLAILKAGGAYVPLDAYGPRERLSFMIEDSQLHLLLTQQGLDARLGDLAPATRTLSIDDEWPQIAQESATNPTSGATPQNVAYVIYTSGSTGMPKGVMVQHQGLVNYLNWCVEAYRVREGNGALVHSPLGFDLTVTGLFAPLLAGRCVTLLPEQGGLDTLSEAVGHGNGYSLLKLTPAHLQALGQLLPAANAQSQTACLVVGGEALYGEQLAFWREHAPETIVVNEYGPTETVVGCCVYAVPAGEVKAGSVPIGKPIGNTKLYVLDQQLRLAPMGVVGELYIGGEGVARGYLNRPALTAERFVPNPFTDEAGTRMYRTGDLVRYLATGDLEYVGRVDHQVKIRGYRIELGEVEAALARHEGVRECAVLAREDVPGEKRLVAYLVLKQELGLLSSELRSFLIEKLPEYMIPTTYIVLDELPLNPNGKVDRRALPAPEQTADQIGDGFPAPRTPTEEMLAEIFADVLRVASIGVGQNFFELGGHSLLATRVVSRLRTAFGVDVALRTLFERPTVSGLSEEIEALLRAGYGSEVPPLVKRATRGPLPLSFAQQRLWFLDQFEPGSSAYNMPFALRLKGRLDIAALKRAMTEVIRRHEVLRTRFVVEEGEPVQVVDEVVPFVLPVVQVEGFEPDFEELIQAEASQPFDLETGPLVRARLLRLDEQEHVLVFTMHHIVSDGWSMGVLMREVGTLYDAYSRGSESPLGELPIQYADYAMWQREWLQGEALERQLEYWRKQLANAPVLELPTVKARPASLSAQSAESEVRLGADAVAALRKLGRREGCTLFMTLLAAFQLVLRYYTGQSDLVVGTPVANRGHSGTEGLFGFFVNTLALRTEVDDDLTFRELLKRVRETCLGAYAHQDVPFERLVEELGVRRELNRNPLFDVMLVLQGAGEQGLPGLGGLEVKAEEWGGAVGAKFDLLLALTEERGGGVRGKLEYREELFSKEVMRRMGQHLERAVAEVVAHGGEGRLSELQLLSEEDLHVQLVAWNDTKREYERDLCVHQLFEAQVQRTPNAIALVSEGETLTYSEPNRRANQLARYLKHKGVGPESVVGVLLERSTEMVVSLLAILKAGGAYLPLDPEYPAARLQMMLEDSGASLLITRSLLDEERASIASESYDNLPCTTTPENLIYVMYTSGSTGQAKGVAVTHRSVMRLVRGANYVDLGPEQVLLQLAPATFDAATFEIWGALLNGGRLVIAPPGPLSLEEIGRTVRNEEVTTLWLTAGLFHQMVDQRAGDLNGVKQLLAGGDVLSPHHVRRMIETCEVLVNGYGPTENTTFTACHRMTEANQLGETVSIGRPISNTQIYILDSGMKPVPVGVTGELYTGGDGLARGYLRRPALTAERFVPNPFSREPGERLYRTGDLARYMEDGRIEFVGRVDEQVKVRGFRIEPGEVETALVQCEGVRESVVAVQEDARGEKLLVAYVVGESAEQPPKPGELRAALRERLPDYMIPTTFVVLDQLPLTPNGKVDRRALPALDGSRPELESRYEKPRTSLEKLLAEMWQDVLEVEAVGIHDDFFELGGTSLRVVVFVNKLEQRLNVHVPVKVLFGAPNVAALAEYLKEHHAQTVSAASREDRSWSPLIEIQPGTNKPPLFFVHPVGGNVFCYFNLARRLGTDQPFYALQSIGLNNGHPGHTRIEEMASYYVEHLRAVQPAGPYHLGGWSLGGVVAFEMARQLKADGDDVALLAMIDSPSPSAFTRMPREDDLSRLASFAIDLGLTQEHVSRSFNDVRSLPLEDHLAYMLDRALAENLIPAGMELDHLQRLFRVFKTNREALRAYVPGVYAGQITYVKAIGNNANQTPNDWHEFARDGVEVHQLPGDHYSILKEPYVNALAQCIEQRLRNPATEPPDNENNLVHF